MKSKRFKVASAIIFIAIMPMFFGCDTQPDEDKNTVTLTAEERELYDLLMNYRAQLGLEGIPLSSSLSYVAQQHVSDLQENNLRTSTCNSHSWSNKGNWTACCYTSDHAQASCMWDKPRELSEYRGNGYEIATYSSGSLTPSAALNSWKNSPPHNDVAINAGVWTSPWEAIGIGIKGNHAVVWFGHEEDPAGPPN